MKILLKRDRRFVTILSALSLILLLTSVSQAAHPLITDDTGTQGRGRAQLEVNGEYSHDSEDGIKTDTLDIRAILSYGIIDNIDLVFTIPYQTIRVKDGEINERSEGLSDISLEMKWRFYEKEGLSLALKPGITLPAGNEDKGLGSGRATYSIFFITSYEHSPYALHLNAGYIRNENRLDERKEIWHLSLAGTIEVADGLKIVANTGIERNPDKESETDPAFILGGLIYSITKDIDIDLGIKGGLNKTETDYSLLAGLTWRF